MEIKKYPKMNLESRKTTYVLTGLAGTLAILFVALEWSSTTRRSHNLVSRTLSDMDPEEIVMTIQQPTPPPPPPPPMPDVIKEFTIVEEPIEEIDFEPISSDDDHQNVEIIDLSTMGGPSEDEEAESMIIVSFAENQPEFPGGEAALMAFIKKHLKYPAFCAENGIQGRTTLSFVVEKDGSIGHIEVMRSPAEELSKEAIRVVQCMPKWKAGKQHGKPVRVKYVLPITFRLS